MPATRTRTREVGSAGHQLWRAKERPDHDGPLLLDTHIWVWTLEGDRGRLSPPVISLVSRAAAEQRLSVCDISFW
ncbi:MAG TPA: hypothetical protein VMM18_11855, partial [Gemmatimonadaceae bacterium]|nr:hypothetical protein [Gemmatimonadaceae bacterium]